MWSTNDILRCSVVWRLNGSDEQANVFHVACGEDNDLEEAELREDLREYFVDMYAEVLQSITDDLVFDRIDIYNLTDDTPQIPLVSVTELNGAGSGERLPEAVAALVWLRTNVKRRQARKYLPCITEANLVNGQWESTTLGRIADFANKWADLFTGSNGAIYRAVVGTSIAGGFLTPSGYAYSPIPAYQRRRRVGRGS